MDFYILYNNKIIELGELKSFNSDIEEERHIHQIILFNKDLNDKEKEDLLKLNLKTIQKYMHKY
jgi:hypothetical protein